MSKTISSDTSFAVVSHIDIECDIGYTVLDIRVGAHSGNSCSADVQKIIHIEFNPDIYTIKQMAAIVAYEAIEQIEKI